MMTGVSGAAGSLKLECRTYTGTDAPALRIAQGSAHKLLSCAALTAFATTRQQVESQDGRRHVHRDLACTQPQHGSISD